jgi:hypothetical protein
MNCQCKNSLSIKIGNPCSGRRTGKTGRGIKYSGKKSEAG